MHGTGAFLELQPERPRRNPDATKRRARAEYGIDRPPEDELALAGSIVRCPDGVEHGRRRDQLAVHGQKRFALLRHASQRRPRRDCVHGTGAFLELHPERPRRDGDTVRLVILKVFPVVVREY